MRLMDSICIKSSYSHHTLKEAIYKKSVLTSAILLIITGCSTSVINTDSPPQPNEATTHTIDTNSKYLKRLIFSDQQDFTEADRGFLAALPNNGQIGPDDNPNWDLKPYTAFIDSNNPDEADTPKTVNPSLWRQAKLVMKHGLYRVTNPDACTNMSTFKRTECLQAQAATENIYQVRNADLSNLTIIEGEEGITIADPLVSEETAKAALNLYYNYKASMGITQKRPVVAIIYSHSHVDHFGGVAGVVDRADVGKGKGKVHIYAPPGFMEHAVSENVYAGNAMSRRASYMYGNVLPPSEKGQIGAGLGLTTSAGTLTLIPPTHTIESTDKQLTIDGLSYTFLLTPNSEAPAEMHWYIDEYKALTAGENANHTLHNLYSLRGAKVRDAKLWSSYLNETLIKWGDKARVFYGMHHWPVWGKDAIITRISNQRDTYKYIHDQTLNLANQGKTMLEISEVLRLPKNLQTDWASRSYYGTMSHDVKAVYNFYLGFFDGNPASLHELPPTEASEKYVKFMGGAEEVIRQAKLSYKEGDYRWVAQVMNHVVFADPENTEAKYLQADALEQLGYVAESGPWRNFYLSGASELRNGITGGGAPDTASPDIVANMTLDMVFDYMAIRLNRLKAHDELITVNFNFKEVNPIQNESYTISLANSVINYYDDPDSLPSQLANKEENGKEIATYTLSRDTLNQVMMGQLSLQEAFAQGKIIVNDGSEDTLLALQSMLDNYDFWFAIVTPDKQMGNTALAKKKTPSNTKEQDSLFNKLSSKIGEITGL